jgi:peptide/nickel transport system permease protein
MTVTDMSEYPGMSDMDEARDLDVVEAQDAAYAGAQAAENPIPAAEEAPVRPAEWKVVARVFRRRKLALFGLVVVVALILVALFAPWVAPYDPYKMDLEHMLAQPSMAHWLGTDELGRDVLSRVIYGARTSLIVAVFAVGLGALIGQTLGLLAGYYGGWLQSVIMRCTDALMAIPMIILAMAISILLGGGLKNVIIALAIGGIAGQARLMCAQTLTVKEHDYVLAGRTIGARGLRQMFRHVYPNAFAPCLVAMTVALGATILAEAGLSFLGAGINPPTAAWGSMISNGYKYLSTNPILCIGPGVAIMLVVFGFNMFGDGLRDALDPRLRGVV